VSWIVYLLFVYYDDKYNDSYSQNVRVGTREAIGRAIPALSVSSTRSFLIILWMIKKGGEMMRLGKVSSKQIKLSLSFSKCSSGTREALCQAIPAITIFFIFLFASPKRKTKRGLFHYMFFKSNDLKTVLLG